MAPRTVNGTAVAGAVVTGTEGTDAIACPAGVAADTDVCLFDAEPSGPADCEIVA
ncbi:hypothetical protein ACFYXS_01130 [Streptomyces sp. NPDC002574]|uniref:hypothetical protein n=1 Tax=Streptomyces sp. NPDC002574 TaxID=3364652 RepID=UPI0036964F89